MSDDEKRRLRDEVAELSMAVRELREQLAQQRQHVCCPGLCCYHYHYTPQPWYPTIYNPYIITYGSSSAPAGTYTTTNALAS